MAKSTKPKAAETKKEETVTVVTTSAKPDSLMTEIDIPKSEAIEKGLISEESKISPIVTINEVKLEEGEPVITNSIEVKAEVINLGEDLPIEQKILNYLDGKSGLVNLNGFLKSLFPSKETNAPPEWTMQSNVKAIKVALEGLVNKGEVIIENNVHKLLCTFHYPDVETMKTAYRGLNDIQIFAKK